MSKKMVLDATLEGYGGPFFLPYFGWYMDEPRSPMNAFTLEERARAVSEHFVETKRITTSDGYVWFWGLFFQIPADDGDHEIVVALPWCQDWGESEGTASDRYPAIYVTPNVTVGEVSRLLKLLAGTSDDVVEDQEVSPIVEE